MRLRQAGHSWLSCLSVRGPNRFARGSWTRRSPTAALLGGQLTGGSTSVADGYDKLRVAGAQARMMLVSAAAQQWGIDESNCHAQNGSVHGPKGKKASYGQLAEAASKLPVPKEPKLKDAKDFN